MRERGAAAARSDKDASTGAVLVVRPSSLGDIVHALTIVADMRANRPELAIDWVAESGFGRLLESHPEYVAIVPVAIRRWRHRRLRRVDVARSRDVPRCVAARDYAAVLDLQEQVKGALIARMARGVRHGPDRASIREPIATLLHDVHHAIDPDQHFIVRCRELAAAALGYRVDGPPRFGLVAAGADAGRRCPSGLSSSSFTARRARTSCGPMRTGGGSSKRSRRAGFPSSCHGEATTNGRAASSCRRRQWRGRAPTAAALVAGLAALLARAELVVGVDTGLVHLAAALGTPTVSLFVATDPMRCGVGRAGACGARSRRHRRRPHAGRRATRTPAN